MPDIVDAYDLTPIQSGMLVHTLRFPGRGIDVEQIVISQPKNYRLDAFRAAWASVLARHAALRTAFAWTELEKPRQLVFSPDGLMLPATEDDWSALEPADHERRLERFLRLDRAHAFDLASPPLMRVHLVHLGASESLFVWTFHHAILDGRAFPFVLADLYEALDGAAPVEPIRRPEFRDYVDWLTSHDPEPAHSYFSGLLEGFSEPTRLWLDGYGIAANVPSANDATKPAFGAAESTLDAQRTTALKTLASDTGVTLNTVLLGAWALLLNRLSGETDLVFGATRSSRRAFEGADRIVGLLINTLPLRVDAQPDQNLGAWLGALRRQTADLRTVEHASLADIQALSAVPRGRLLFETLVVYDHQTLDDEMRGIGGAWRDRRFRYIGQTNYPLAFIAYGGDRVSLRIEYNRERFTDAVATRLLGYLETLLAALAAAAAATRLGDLAMVPPHEAGAIVARGQALTKSAPRGTLHERFDEIARRFPDSIAVTADGASLAYAELAGRAEHLAGLLAERGVGPNDLVGLALERGPDLVTSILAILKAGAAYLPLDPAYPPERLDFMRTDAAARCVLTTRAIAARLAFPDAAVLAVDEVDYAGPPPPPPRARAGPDDLAYVIYTSGSTGTPKGVRITHANVLRLFTATDPWFAFTESDVWTLFHSYAFDFSVWELWGALLYGGRLVVVPHWVSRDPPAFRRLLIDEGVTILNQTPSAFRQLVHADLAEPASEFALKAIVFGGEALELASLAPWVDRYGDVAPRLVNMYGITETTVHVTYRPITAADIRAGTGSVIGLPIPDLALHLLDAAGRPVPDGVPGEIHVGGAGLAQGYLNRPELTAQRFIPDPFSETPGARLYRSGDLARRLPDGDLEFLGRIDSQVKIRGFRIELGEIEAALAARPDIADAAVIVREDTPGDKRLAAYLVAAGDGADASAAALAPDRLRDALAARLPAHMLPAHFIVLPALPLNSNGKLDRAALPVPSEAGRPVSGSDRAATPPRTAAEQTIAAIWADVLRQPSVGVHENYFDLGGDSILSIQIASRCRRAGYVVSVRDIFEHPTVAELAARARIADAPAGEPAAGSRGAALAVESGSLPPTPIQRWFFEQDFTDPHHWNQAFLFEVPANLDLARLAGALGRLIDRHDALRLRFADPSAPTVAPPGAPPPTVTRHDLAAEPPELRPRLIATLAAAHQATLDLRHGPLIRAAYFDCGRDEPGRLLIACHHQAIDGVSWRILLEDLATDEARPEGRDALAHPATSFGDWAGALARYAADPAVAAARPLWREIVATPPAPLPARPSARLERCAATLGVSLTPAETDALLRRVPAAFQTQINDALLAALATALRTASDVDLPDTVRIDMEGHGREPICDALDVSRTIGWFTTLFPARLPLDAIDDIAANLAAQRRAREALPHRGLSYGLLRYPPAGAPAATDLVPSAPAEILFNYLGQFDRMCDGQDLFTPAPEPVGHWHAPAARRTHALEILSQVRDGALRADLTFVPEELSQTLVERLATGFAAALRDIIAASREPADPAHQPSAATLPLSSEPPAPAPLGDTPPAPVVVDTYPLTPMQRLFYVMDRAGSSIGLEHWQFAITGPLDPERLRGAFEEVTNRHTIFRTAFRDGPDGEPVQAVAAHVAVPWQDHDWRGHDEPARARLLETLLAREAADPFDLENPPLQRIHLCRLGDADWRLVWTTHHLCVDGWSWPRFFAEIAEAYGARASGRAQPSSSAPSAGPSPAYATYVRWLAARDPAASDAFWRAHLEAPRRPTPLLGEPVPGLAPDGRITGDAGDIALTLDGAATARLNEAARIHRVTLSTLVQGAWALLLAHASGTDDVVFGAALSGRPEEIADIERLIGPCVTNVPVRATIPPSAPIADWLTALQRQLLALQEHQFTPIERIQALSAVPGGARLFESLVVVQNHRPEASGMFPLSGGAELRPLQMPEATTYTATLVARPGAELALRLIHDPERLTPVAARQLLTCFRDLLITMAAIPPAGTIDDLRATLPASLERHAAPPPRPSAAASPTTTRPVEALSPRSPTESRLAAIWAACLGHRDFTIHDNFFDAGGKSVLLMQVYRAVRDEFAATLPIVALLRYPTIEALAAHLDATTPTAAPAVPSNAMDRAARQREALARRRRSRPNAQ